MQILLIQPKMNKRPMDTDLKTRMAPSLALMTLVKLTPDKHQVIIVNENIDEIDFSVTVDLVGITVTLDVLPRASSIAKRFQEQGIPVVAGGVHITCAPDECIPFFDAICVGAAERVWSRIIDDAERGTLAKVYHDMDAFTGEEIVSPAYNRLKESRYLYTNVVSTSRGCPNRCDFCYNSCHNRIHVRRPISHVLDDIREIGIPHILFIDDNFIGDPAYAFQLLESLRPLNLKWSAAVTTQILDYPELLDLMRDTGCQSLFIGLESINNNALNSVHKHNSFEQYKSLVEAIHSRGIMINASMVFGLDGDEADVFLRTLEWLVQNRIETLTSHIMTPYPGTALYRRLDAEGRITDYDLSKYNTAHVVFQPRDMTAEELYSGYLWMYKKFYSFKSIIRRLPAHKKQWMPYLLFNFFYRKFGRFTSVLSRIIPMHFLGRIAARMSYKVKN